MEPGPSSGVRCDPMMLAPMVDDKKFENYLKVQRETVPAPTPRFYVCI